MPRRSRVEVSLTLGRPADVVYRALTDERESHHWRQVTAAAYDIGGPCVVGAKFWRSDGHARRSFEVTACDPFAFYAVAAIDGDGDAVESIACASPDPLTTEVQRVLEGLGANWFAPLARWRLRRRLRGELEAARRWLEGEGSP